MSFLATTSSWWFPTRIDEGDGVGYNNLDLGSGTGTHVVYLVQSGFSVFGLDNSPEGIAITRRWLAEEGLEKEPLSQRYVLRALRGQKVELEKHSQFMAGKVQAEICQPAACVIEC